MGNTLSYRITLKITQYSRIKISLAENWKLFTMFQMMAKFHISFVLSSILGILLHSVVLLQNKIIITSTFKQFHKYYGAGERFSNDLR